MASTVTPRPISTPSLAARSDNTDSTASRLVNKKSGAGLGSRNGRAATSTLAGSSTMPAKWPTPLGGAGSSASGPGSSWMPDAASSGRSISRR